MVLCPNCGVEFYPYREDGRGSRKKFCSHKCWAALRSAWRAETRTCEECGKVYGPRSKASRREWNQATPCCSTSCATKRAWRVHRTMKSGGSARGKAWDRSERKTCMICGQAFGPRPKGQTDSRASFEARQTCGRECAARLMHRTKGIKERIVLCTGYVSLWVPDHPRARNGRLPEHRFVMEQVLGRQLLPSEEVHHRNGDRSDNRPENLELWDRSHPPGQRVEEKIEWCKAFLAAHGLSVRETRKA